MSRSLLVSWCANGCVVKYECVCVSLLCVQVSHLAVHDEVADAAGEVFMLKLRVDVGDVFVHTTKLQYLAHVQVSKTHKGMETHIYKQTLLTTGARSTLNTDNAISLPFAHNCQNELNTQTNNLERSTLL